MCLLPNPVQLQLIRCAADAGLAVRRAVAALPVHLRTQKAPTPLKPPPAVAALPDLRGEQAAFACFKGLAEQTQCEIRVVVDPASGQFHSITPQHAPQDPASVEPHQGSQSQHIYVYLDAVDGTVKLSGLGNSPTCARVVNDGAWAVGLSLTEPTTATLAELKIADFSVACIIDGAAPPAQSTAGPSSVSFPAAAVAYRASTQPTTYQTHALVLSETDSSTEHSPSHLSSPDSLLGPALIASSCTQLNQVFAYLDAFQAFDRASQAPGDERLATALYAALINRHEGGAFDVLRSYGNLSALLRTMLGWGTASSCSSLPPPSSDAPPHQGPAPSDPLFIEPQCGVFAVVNENLANLLPCVPIVLGAGASATDFAGQPLVHRTLAQGRTNVLYTANTHLQQAVRTLLERLKV